MDMIERVARALHGASYVRFTWERMITPERDSYVRCARAAIEAMREPTKEMIDAADGPWLDDDRPSLDREWRMVIDAMLKLPDPE